MRKRPISWPKLDGLSPQQAKSKLANYSKSTEVKAIRHSLERAGIGTESINSMEAEYVVDSRCYSEGQSACLRADDLRLCVTDRPRAPVNGELLPGGGSHSRPLRTQVIRGLGSEVDLDVTVLRAEVVAVMVRCDNLASPNTAPKRRAVVHSAGKDVQRHVISESVPGAYLPMRQVAEPSQPTYETVEVDSLPSRPLTLSDLRLELGIVHNRERSLFAKQLEAAIHALEMLVAIENLIDNGKLSL